MAQHSKDPHETDSCWQGELLAEDDVMMITGEELIGKASERIFNRNGTFSLYHLCPISKVLSMYRNTTLGHHVQLLLRNFPCSFGRDTLIGLELLSRNFVDEHLVDLFQ